MLPADTPIHPFFALGQDVGLETIFSALLPGLPGIDILH
jgi:hypothetical protein